MQPQLAATPTKRLDDLAKRIGRLKEGMDLLTPTSIGRPNQGPEQAGRTPIDAKAGQFKFYEHSVAVFPQASAVQGQGAGQTPQGRRGTRRRHSTSSSDISRTRTRPRGRSFDLAWDTSSKELVPPPEEPAQRSSSSSNARRLQRTKSQPVLVEKPFQSRGFSLPEDNYTRDWDLDFAGLFQKHRVKKTGLVDLHAFIQAASEAIKDNLEDDDLRKAFFRYAKNYLDAGNSDDSKVLNATDFIYAMIELRNAAIFRSLDAKRTGYLTSVEVVEGARRALSALETGERAEIIRQMGDQMVDLEGFNRILVRLEIERDNDGQREVTGRPQTQIPPPTNSGAADSSERHSLQRPAIPAAKLAKRESEPSEIFRSQARGNTDAGMEDASANLLMSQLEDLVQNELNTLKLRERTMKAIRPTKIGAARTRDKSTQTRPASGENMTLLELRLESKNAEAKRLERAKESLREENASLNVENKMLRRRAERAIEESAALRAASARRSSRSRSGKGRRRGSKRKKQKKRRKLSPNRTNLALKKIASRRRMSKSQIAKRVRELNGSLKTMERMIKSRRKLSARQATKTRLFVGELAIQVDQLKKQIRWMKAR